MEAGGSNRRRNLTLPVLAATLIALVVALLVAGCDGSATATTTLPSSTTTAADTSTSAPLEAATTSSTEPPAATTTSTTSPTPTTSPAPHTPAKGTAERTAIMDAQRAYMAAHGMPSDVVFVVNWLRVAGGWAYSKVDPQSPDGGAQYESLAFLLRDRGGWKVVDIFGSEGDMSEDATAEDYMMSRNPEAPADLFP